MKLTLDAQGFPLLDGRPLALPPKERAVLALLLRAQPALVDKVRFADEAWRGAAMSDESLARCISRLRRALPELAIEAVYGSGYRLVGPTPAEAGAEHHAGLLQAAQAPPQAVETYLHARQLAAQRTPRALARAIALLRALVQAEPGYAAARLALAEALGASLSWGLLAAQAGVDEALAQLDAVAQVEPGSPGLLSLRGWLLDYAWRFDEAEALHAQALAREGETAETLFMHGWHLLACGAPAAALGRLRRALALQPFALHLRITVVRALAYDGRLDQALQEADALCLEHPHSPVAAGYRLALRAALAPQPALLEQAEWLLQQPDAPPFALGVASYTLACCGDRDGASELIAATLGCSQASACGAAMHAAACVALGEPQDALRLLQAACEQRCALLPILLQEPTLAPLRDEPMLRALWQQVFARRP